MKELQEAEDMQVSHWPYRVKAPDFLVSHWQSCVTTGFDTRPLLVKSHLTSQQLMLVKNGGFELFGRTSDPCETGYKSDHIYIIYRDMIFLIYFNFVSGIFDDITPEKYKNQQLYSIFFLLSCLLTID